MLISMKKNYGRVKSFRLDKNDETLLNECFEILIIASDSFNANMSTFINRVHKGLEELTDLRKKVKDQQQQIKELNKKIPLPIEEIEKPQPPKSEDESPTQIMQKPRVSKKIEKPKPTRETVKLSADGQSVLCKGAYYNNYVDYKICNVCQDKECEVKKGTVKLKPRNSIRLKRW